MERFSSMSLLVRLFFCHVILIDTLQFNRFKRKNDSDQKIRELPCNENWKREELKRHLLRCPIMQWEGSPIQHMGQPAYLSLVNINNIKSQGSQERLFVLFPLDLLILSVDSHRLWIKYEGRLPRKSIRALEKSARHGRLEFELTGELMESQLVSCTSPEDYQNWIFQLQQPEKTQAFPNHTPPPLIPKKHRS